MSWAPCKSKVNDNTSVLNVTLCKGAVTCAAKPGTGEAVAVGVIATGATGTPPTAAAGSLAGVLGLTAVGAPNSGGFPWCTCQLFQSMSNENEKIINRMVRRMSILA